MMRTRDEVQINYHQGNRHEPMVNVKVSRWSMDDGWREFRADEHVDPRFTEEWVEEHVGDNGLDATFWDVCTWRFEDAEEVAREIFEDTSLVVGADGRSGGWLVVQGLGDVGEWNAVTLAKWWKFERYCRAQADDVMRGVVSSVYHNEFESWCTEQEEEQAERDEYAGLALATVASYGDEA